MFQQVSFLVSLFCWLCLRVQRRHSNVVNFPSKMRNQKRSDRKRKRSCHLKSPVFIRNSTSIFYEERARQSNEVYVENMAAGVTATLISFYGYYFDNRGVLAKVAYGLTQTAGVVVISDAVYARSKPSFLLLADRHLQQQGR